MKHFSIVLTLLWITPGIGSAQDHPICGYFIGQQVDLTVDHELAQYYFYRSLDSSHYVPRLETLLKDFAPILEKDTITSDDLKFLSNHISVDFATLVFAQKTYYIQKNKNAQTLFGHYLDAMSNEYYRDDAMEGYLYVFVPSLFYSSFPKRGGDFERQRNLLNTMGFATFLIETNEVGTVLENATIIANELRRLSEKYPNIIVASASKGGADLSYALGKLMSGEELKAVKAWISFGGVLKGSKVAEYYLKGFNSWYTKFALMLMGTNADFLKDISCEKSRLRFDSLHFPVHLPILHYVGAPLSSQVGRIVRKSHRRLSAYGPNDGFVLLADQLTAEGVVITDLGLDHFYKDQQSDNKMVALIYTIIQLIDQNESTFTYGAPNSQIKSVNRQ